MAIPFFLQGTAHFGHFRCMFHVSFSFVFCSLYWVLMFLCAFFVIRNENFILFCVSYFWFFLFSHFASLANVPWRHMLFPFCFIVWPPYPETVFSWFVNVFALRLFQPKPNPNHTKCFGIALLCWPSLTAFPTLAVSFGDLVGELCVPWTTWAPLFQNETIDEIICASTEP